MVTTTNDHLTRYWAAGVQAMESAVSSFTLNRLPRNDCQVTFFEIAGDEQLHVNVTHKYRTKSAKGWAGPGDLPDGFVHNRRFGQTEANQVVRHIRNMVFAKRI